MRGAQASLLLGVGAALVLLLVILPILLIPHSGSGAFRVRARPKGPCLALRHCAGAGTRKAHTCQAHMTQDCASPDAEWTYDQDAGLVHPASNTAFMPAMQGAALTTRPETTTAPGSRTAKGSPLLLLHGSEEEEGGAVHLWYPYTSATGGATVGSHRGAFLTHDSTGAVAWSGAPDRSHNHGAASALFLDFSLQALASPASFAPTQQRLTAVQGAQFATLAPTM